MSFPIPDLDDRRFQDLVDEAKRMIPQFLPEWTNHNVSDPGVALIELFAWMTDLMLYRLNRLPDRLYCAFLDLVGISPFPASPARAPVTFWFSAVPEEPVMVPAGTEVATLGDDPVVFATVEDLLVTQPELTQARTVPGVDGEPDDSTCTDVAADLRLPNESVAIFPSRPVQPGDALYLGFRRSLGGYVLQLDVVADVEGIGVDPRNPPLRWEVWVDEGWAPCHVQSDSTGGVNRNGRIVLLVPSGHEQIAVDGERAYWMRLVLAEPTPGQPMYSRSPVVRELSVRAIGGTADAEHSEPFGEEHLGTSDGSAGQVFATQSAPLLERREGERVVVRSGGVTTEWTEVSDFAASGPDDTHVIWDSVTGQVRFGPRVRWPDGTHRQHGMVPPAGAAISVTAYRRGGGAHGNVGVGSLSVLRSPVPYVDRVTNRVAAVGGIDPETIDNAKVRGPLTLVSGGRAVTVRDHEQLAMQASPRVARALCLPPEHPGGPTRLHIVPDPGRAPEGIRIDHLALDERLITDLMDHLEPRRVLGTSLELLTPYYQGVSVAALVRVAPGRAPAGVRQRCLDTLWRVLSPVHGGPDGQGWPFGTPVTSGALANALAEVPGVEVVDEVVLFEADIRNGRRLPASTDIVRIAPDALPLGFGLQVVAR